MKAGTISEEPRVRKLWKPAPTAGSTNGNDDPIGPDLVTRDHGTTIEATLFVDQNAPRSKYHGCLFVLAEEKGFAIRGKSTNTSRNLDIQYFRLVVRCTHIAMRLKNPSLYSTRSAVRTSPDFTRYTCKHPKARHCRSNEQTRITEEAIVMRVAICVP